ncbi:hypothetical protein Hypma_006726 [Hypsizygus marmoreus]|uniref:Uncharacterized protein n=1 Tax=Hypsizygus marmoreus TaxID=39966 RepID=A0A369JUG9_HYPMA|nr:hypothetical protein Hypma_006726 [Hypsizygus marmoreus]
MELPDNAIVYDNSFTTNTTADPAEFAAWFSQLNTTLTSLKKISMELRQPPSSLVASSTEIARHPS